MAVPVSRTQQGHGPHERGFANAIYTVNNSDHVDSKFFIKNGENLPVQEGETSLLMAEWSIDFMPAEPRKNKPFFITLWFHSPHKPYGTLQEFIAGLIWRFETAARGATYFGQLTAVDQAVGRLGVKSDKPCAR